MRLLTVLSILIIFTQKGKLWKVEVWGMVGVWMRPFSLKCWGRSRIQTRIVQAQRASYDILKRWIDRVVVIWNKHALNTLVSFSRDCRRPSVAGGGSHLRYGMRSEGEPEIPRYKSTCVEIMWRERTIKKTYRKVSTWVMTALCGPKRKKPASKIHVIVVIPLRSAMAAGRRRLCPDPGSQETFLRERVWHRHSLLKSPRSLGFSMQS